MTRRTTPHHISSARTAPRSISRGTLAPLPAAAAAAVAPPHHPCYCCAAPAEHGVMLEGGRQVTWGQDQLRGLRGLRRARAAACTGRGTVCSVACAMGSVVCSVVCAPWAASAVCSVVCAVCSVMCDMWSAVCGVTACPVGGAAFNGWVVCRAQVHPPGTHTYARAPHLTLVVPHHIHTHATDSTR